jgi:hypothetical protein
MIRDRARGVSSTMTITGWNLKLPYGGNTPDGGQQKNGFCAATSAAASAFSFAGSGQIRQ